MPGTSAGGDTGKVSSGFLAPRSEKVKVHHRFLSVRKTAALGPDHAACQHSAGRA